MVPRGWGEWPVCCRLVHDPLQWNWPSARWFAEQAGPIAIDEVRLPMNPSDWI